MVSLGLGQAILGGIDDNYVVQNRIYHITCSQHICMVSKMNKELSVPRAFFVAIPIPDSMSGCISQSKFGFIVKHFIESTQSSTRAFYETDDAEI